ncbi:MAG: FUSC family protein, partial [Rhodanobacter sp.]
MRLLNQRYMAASTSFQSLHHLINRLQRRGRSTVADALIALYRPIGAALSTPSAQQHDPGVLAVRLLECMAQLPAQTRRLRAAFDDEAAQLEFDTGAALLQRFAAELAEFTATEDSTAAAVETKPDTKPTVRIAERKLRLF